MTNYIFYRITHPNFPLLNYIGSTKDFHKRKIQYKTAYKNPKQVNYNCKLYKYIRDNKINFQSLNFSIIVVLLYAQCSPTSFVTQYSTKLTLLLRLYSSSSPQI